MTPDLYELLALDPLEFHAALWPDSRLYDKQQEIVLSVEHNVETIVVAGNKLGVCPPSPAC